MTDGKDDSYNCDDCRQDCTEVVGSPCRQFLVREVNRLGRQNARLTEELEHATQALKGMEE